jgi:hypothetical protein
MTAYHSLYGKILGVDVVNGGLILDGVRAAVSGSNAFVAAGSALTLTVDAHAGKTIQLDTATGSTVTLPDATGSGAKFRFLVTVLATSNSHIIKVPDADNTMIGGIVIADTDTGGAASSFMAAATSDTITLNRSTTGSVSLGEWIEVEDVAANKWAVRGLLSGTGVVATPFSAAV